VTFLAAPGGMEAILEADKRGGLFSDGHDAVNRFTVSHQGVEHVGWNAEVDSWVQQLLEHHASHDTHALYGHGDPYGGGHHGHGEHHHDGHHGSRPSIGTAVATGAAGLAVGVAGGKVAAEVVDEIGDAFEDEEEEGEEG